MTKIHLKKDGRKFSIFVNEDPEDILDPEKYLKRFISL